MEKLVWLEAFGRAALQFDSAIAGERAAAMARDAWARYPEFSPKLVAFFELGKHLDAGSSVLDMKGRNTTVMDEVQTRRPGC